MREIFAAEAPALAGAASFKTNPDAALRKLDARCDAETVLMHWRMIDVDQAVLATIRRLRAGGIYCALASNQEDSRARHMSEELGYRHLFDREFYSCDLGCMKPSTDYFEKVIQHAAVEPAHTLFIDDRLENVDAARRCGLLAEQFVLGQVDDGAQAMEQLLRKHGLLTANCNQANG